MYGGALQLAQNDPLYTCTSPVTDARCENRRSKFATALDENRISKLIVLRLNLSSVFTPPSQGKTNNGKTAFVNFLIKCSFCFDSISFTPVQCDTEIAQ